MRAPSDEHPAVQPAESPGLCLPRSLDSIDICVAPEHAEDRFIHGVSVKLIGFVTKRQPLFW